ncbi:hypothetical protein MVES_001874 [Malassezia vespertilionis]|uniref:CRAL-TRIO domain-containing protein n=1 Tax=Malassezia vespertilionis TaxID=2020962 RepID=A0A2N1JBN6_9BASI|nr:hypothetical protein MVES_001874 [Malassezia vespertilionis]
MSKAIPKQVVKVPPGHIGNLDSSQKSKLAKIWLLYLHVLENPEKAQSGQIIADEAPDEGAPPLSKEEKAKEEKAHQEEAQALKLLFKTHGVDEFYNQFWLLCGPDNPDMMMLKFLRARKCLNWRIDTDVVGLLTEGDLGISKRDSKYLAQAESEKAFVAGMNDEQMPIIYIRVKKHLGKAQGEDTMTKFIIATAESFRSFISFPNDKVIIVFDLSGFGMKNMDWHALMTILQILEAYYPETLYKLYIVNAPWIFQGIWKAVSPLLDPVVRSKIIFTNKAAEMKNIPKDRLMSDLGGTLTDYPHYIPPKEGDNQSLPVNDPKRKKAMSSFIKEAKVFEEIDKLDEERMAQSEKMRLRFLEIYPLLRAKTLYDRAGIFTPDFTQHWEYKQSDGSVLTQNVGEEYGISALRKRIAQREQSFAPQGQSNEQKQNNTNFAKGPQRAGDASQSGNMGADSAASRGNDATTGAVAGGAAAGVAAGGAGAAAMASRKKAQPANRSAAPYSKPYASSILSTTSGDEQFYDTVEDISSSNTRNAEQGAAAGAGASLGEVTPAEAVASATDSNAAVSWDDDRAKTGVSQQEWTQGDGNAEQEEQPTAQQGNQYEEKDAQGFSGAASKRADEGGMRYKQGTNKSPLAGFPDLANGNGAETINKANEEAQHSVPAQQQAKRGFFSRLNCFSSKTY